MTKPKMSSSTDNKTDILPIDFEILPSNVIKISKKDRCGCVVECIKRRIKNTELLSITEVLLKLQLEEYNSGTPDSIHSVKKIFKTSKRQANWTLSH